MSLQIPIPKCNAANPYPAGNGSGVWAGLWGRVGHQGVVMLLGGVGKGAGSGTGERSGTGGVGQQGRVGHRGEVGMG